MKRWLGAHACAAILLLSACGQQPQKEQGKPTSSSGKEWTASDKAAAEAAFPLVKLPVGAPPPPVTGACLDRMCEANKVQFIRQDWPKAWQGDYQGQRNTAYCRSTGCDGAVTTNKVEACAWRAVILAAHVGATDDTDNNNIKRDCGALDEAEAALAAKTSNALHEKVYGKKMPAR